MALETGFVQFFEWDEADGGAYGSSGLVLGGGLGLNSPDNRRPGIGAQAAWSAGGIDARVSPEVGVTAASKPLILHAVRASYPAGALQALDLRVGTAQYDWLLEDAVINSLRLSGAPEDPLRATFDIVALLATEAAAGGEEAAVGTLLDWYHGSVLFGADPYDCRSFQAELNNNVTPRFNLDAKTPTAARFPGVLSLGDELVTLRLNLGEKLAYDVLADTPARNVAVTIEYTDGVTTVTLAFTDMAVTGGLAMPFQAGADDVLWDLELQGAPGCLAIT